jgi:serine/threonine protein kinase
MFKAICEGVAHAHTNGITHRDIKPDNIFLSSDRRPIVGDFGICFLEGAERLTATGEWLGPRGFICPESEGKADEVRPSCDVYSLGKLLYWIMSGGTMLPRERHKEPSYNLIEKQPDTASFLVYELLNKTVVESQAGRLHNAAALADEVAILIRRIEMGAHAINLSAPQGCNYCGLGSYEVVVDTRKCERGMKFWEVYSAQLLEYGVGGLDRMGLVNTHWLIFRCDHCGNIQYFKGPVEGSLDPAKWWPKS